MVTVKLVTECGLQWLFGLCSNGHIAATVDSCSVVVSSSRIFLRPSSVSRGTFSVIFDSASFEFPVSELSKAEAFIAEVSAIRSAA